MKLKFDLSFFADVMHERQELLSYALLAKTEEGCETEYRPVIMVKGINLFAYDIRTAQFTGIVSVPEVKMEVEPANVRKSFRGVVFKSEVSGVEETYTTLDFYHTYKTLVVNDYLR